MYSKLISNTIDSVQFLLSTGLYLTGNGYIKTLPCYEIKDEPICDHRLIYISSGEGILKCQGKEHIIVKNDVFFLFPGERFHLRTNPENPLEYWWVNFNGSNVKDLIGYMNINPTLPVITGIINPNFILLLENIICSRRDNEPSNILNMTGSLYKIFGIIFDEFNTTGWKTVKYNGTEVTYYGTWSIWSSPFEISGGEHFTNTPRSYVEFKFNGTGVKWLGVMSSDCGFADVFIDGVFETSVDTYSSHRISRQLLFVKTDLSNGIHSIKIACTGKKNQCSSSLDIVIDAFKYFSPSVENNMEFIKLNVSKLIQKSIDFIKSNFSHEISVEQLSEISGMSRSYFTTKFRAETGVSPNEYITLTRMKQAKYFLSNTSLSVKEIAFSVGFQDIFYFSRLFKKVEKVTPSEYRTFNTK